MALRLSPMYLALRRRTIRGPNFLSQTELTRDVRDLDDYQLCEALNGPSNQTASWGAASPMGVPKGNLRALWEVVKVSQRS